MKTGAIQIKDLRQGKRQSPKLCLFLCHLPQFMTTCPHLTGEKTMTRTYVVENWFGNWTVWCGIYNETGKRISKKLTDIFPNYKKDEAMAKAELGNYIVKKSTEAFRELVEK
jgi:hypothetical protein